MVNKLNNGASIRKVVETYTKYYKVPNIFYKGAHLGGCNQLVELEKAGELENLAREQSGQEGSKGQGDNASPSGSEEHKISRTGLFFFPSTVNNYAVRIQGVSACILCLFGIIFRNHSEMKWIILGLAVDFFLRFIAGPTFSPMGVIAAALTAPFRPKFSPGPPKQFASSVGLTFAAVAAGLLLGGYEVAGAVVLAGLMGATGLEGFLNFCLGCLFFGWMIDFKLLPKSVYKYHLETRPEVERGWEKFHVKEENLPEVREVRVSPRPSAQEGPLPIDPKIKTNLDEHKWFDSSLLRHMQVIYFLHPLSLAILALVWSMMSSPLSPYDSPKEIWHTLAAVSAVLFGIYLVVYGLKCWFYPQKVNKDWQHPLRGNMVIVIPANVILLSKLLYDADGDEESAQVIFWIGACSSMVMSLAKCSDWFYSRWSLESVNVSMMSHPLVAFFASFVGPSLSPSYVEASYWWFSYGLIMYFALFAVLSLKTILDHHSDERTRPSQGLFIVAPVLASLSFQALTGQTGMFFRVFYYFGYSMLGVALFGAMSGFFLSNKFSQTNWIWSIAFSGLTAGTISYDREIQSEFTEVWVYLMLALTNVGVGVQLFHTINQYFHWNLFVSDDKWGPMSFMKLTHEAFRCFAPKVEKLIKTSGRSDKNIRLLVEKLHPMVQVYDIHSEQEGNHIFPMLERFLPGISDDSSSEHEEQHAFVDRLRKSVETLRASKNDKLEESNPEDVKLIFDELPGFMKRLLEHLREEETSISVIMRKYVSIDLQKDTCVKCFENLSYDRMATCVGWCVQELELGGQRVRFLRSLIWGMPTQMEVIGMMVYRQVDDVKWAQLSDSIPEMIPRGLSGWHRYV